MKNFTLKAKTGNYNLRSDGIDIKIKRGEKNWAYFPLSYNILLTLFVGIISVLPDFGIGYFWCIKIILIIICAIILFWLCFFNDWFRNRIVGIFSISANKEEGGVINI